MLLTQVKSDSRRKTLFGSRMHLIPLPIKSKRCVKTNNFLVLPKITSNNHCQSARAFSPTPNCLAFLLALRLGVFPVQPLAWHYASCGGKGQGKLMEAESTKGQFFIDVGKNIYIYIIKGSLEDTSELRRVEKRCDWKGEMKEAWCQLDGMSMRKWREKFGSDSKIAREMLCFTMETVVGGREGIYRRCRTGGCGPCSHYVCAMSALWAGETAMAGGFRGRG